MKSMVFLVAALAAAIAAFPLSAIGCDPGALACVAVAVVCGPIGTALNMYEEGK